MSSQLKLQNTEVFVSLVGGNSIATPGDTSKYFTCTQNGSTDRIYVDGCTTDSSKLFAIGDFQRYVKHAVEGGTSSVFLSASGITRLADYDRKQFMSDLCQSISRCMSDFDPDMSMTYAFVGVTDQKMIDFHHDCSVSPEAIEHGLADLQHEVDDWEMVEQKILRGSTLPFILSLHFESLHGTPTNGHFCIVDLNFVDWSPLEIPRANEQPSDPMSSLRLQQSTRPLTNLIHLLANGTILTGATVQSNPLVDLTGEFLYGESKTAFAMYVSSDESPNGSLESTIELIASLRRLKSREIIRPVDRRVLFFYEKAKYYQSEKYRFQDELADTQDEKEALEKDLDDIQRDYSDEREALVKEVSHWQERSRTLEETLDQLRSENEGMEADARWENAKLVTEKLALRDEIRRREIELTLSEDEKSRLLDLTEALQESHVLLDALHGKLFDTYRDLAVRFVDMANKSDTMQIAVEELKDQSAKDRQDLEALRASAQSDAQSYEKYMTDMEDQQMHVVGELEAQLTAAAALSKELKGRVAKLEAENRRLTMSQTAETKDLQKTVAELTSHLEFSRQEMMNENAELANRLHMSQRTVKHLENDNARMVGRLEAMASGSGMNGAEASWEREREQLTKKIKRLQRAAEAAEQRALEMREDGESSLSEWQREKQSADERHRRLTGRVQSYAEHAADVSSALDEERTNGAAMPAAAAVSRLARNRQAEEQPLDQMMAQLETDDNEEVATATEEPVQQAKRRGRPPKKKAAAETGGSQVPGKKMPPKEATRRGRGRRTKHTEAHGAGAGADDIGDVSMARGKQPAARRRKTILEMDAELRTQPARKRGSKKGPQQRQSEEGESAEPRIGDTQETLAADEPRAPSPKRKRMGKTAITLGPVSSEGTGAGAALKKKRKLNLKRIQTILGGNGQAKAAPSRPAAETASNPMALKFSVPKIRSKPQDLGS